MMLLCFDFCLIIISGAPLNSVFCEVGSLFKSHNLLTVICIFHVMLVLAVSGLASLSSCGLELLQ